MIAGRLSLLQGASGLKPIIMANTTDPFAQTVHGTNPQYLVEKITRLKIYNCVYWKEQCFGLTAATIIDKAIALK